MKLHGHHEHLFIPLDRVVTQAPKCSCSAFHIWGEAVRSLPSSKQWPCSQWSTNKWDPWTGKPCFSLAGIANPLESEIYRKCSTADVSFQYTLYKGLSEHFSFPFSFYLPFTRIFLFIYFLLLTLHSSRPYHPLSLPVSFLIKISMFRCTLPSILSNSWNFTMEGWFLTATETVA